MKAQKDQNGFTLIVGLVVMILITVAVIGVFRTTSADLRLAGNVQLRNEAVAATNDVLEQVVGSAFYAGSTTTASVDIDGDGSVDYTVAVGAPVCTKAWAVQTSTPSAVDLGASLTSASIWLTEWDLEAAATGASGSAAVGTSVHIREGVRVSLSEDQKNIYCP